MKPGGLPTVVAGNGKAVTKTKLSLTTRVANNSQKKIDTLNRIDDVTLKSMHRFYDLEMVICEAAHKKDSYLLRRQIASYQKSLTDSKNQRQKTAKKTFITDPPSSPEQKTTPRVKYGSYANSDPEAIGSVRRRTKSIASNSVSRSMCDLQRLRDKNLKEYQESLAELARLQSRLDLQLQLNVPERGSDTPFTAPAPFSPIIISLRNKIRYSENELRKLKKRLSEMSIKYNQRPKTTGSELEDEEEEEEEEPQKKQETFKVFCDKKNQGLGDRQFSTLTDRPVTTVPVPQHRSRRNSRAVKFDLVKLKSEGELNKKTLDMLAAKARNSYIEVVDNPFDTGVIPESTRSRLLVECKKDEGIYKWLGFETKSQMESAIKDNPGSIKQIPAALLSLIEDDENEAEDLDKEQFSDTEEEDNVDEDDMKFKVFDEKKFKRRRSSVLFPPPPRLGAASAAK